MSSFLEQYGKSIFVIVLIAILISFASPLGATVKDTIQEKAEYTNDIGTTAVQAANCYIVSVDGKEYARGYYNDLITITAEKKEGSTFAGWKDEYGKVISTKESYTFRLSGDRTFISVYDEEIKVEAYAKMTNAFVVSKNENESGNVRFVGQIIVPKGYRVQECGVIGALDDTTTMPKLYESDGKSLTVLAKKAVAKSYTCNYQFSITFNKIANGKTVRGVIYAKLTNGTDTVYVFSYENSVTVK
jgi:hypothetical protein